MSLTAREPYDTFRPRAGALVARLAAVASVVVFGLTAVLATTTGERGSPMDIANRVAIFLFGCAMAAFLWRYTQIRAVPSQAGLHVVNLFSRTDVEWAQIMRVGYSGSSPWVVLELTDTEELSVMAIQRADGTFGAREASRLAALVEHHQPRDLDI